MTHPDGSRHWPPIGIAPLRDVAPVAQYQMVQTTLEDIDVNLVVERDLDASEERALERIIHESLGHPFRLHFRYHAAAIPRGPGYKFEQFQSRL